MTWTHQDQLQAQRTSMQMARAGHTNEQVIAAKGRNCTYCGNHVDDADLVITHKAGGGRHATETGQIIPGKSHAMDNLGIAHRACDGRHDAIRGGIGLGIEGNSNNPSQ